MEIYLVGGALRDKLLGLPIKDRDWVVTGATPEMMLDAGFQQVGADFPVFLHPENKEEFALARTERKSGKGYNGFICDFAPDIILEDDLARRDLTINAIAQDNKGQLIDPYGGINDINNKVLRHISTAFSEDPLRVLRVARFASRYADLGFTVHPDTIELMTSLARSGELDALTAERVWAETHKALQTPQPSVFFETLRQCGALQVLLPEIDALFGVPQVEKHHPEIDTGIHTMMAVDWAAREYRNPMVTWATLLHDLGKGLTDKDILPKHHGHEKAGVPLVEGLCKRFKVPSAYRELAGVVTEYHTHCHRMDEMRPGSVYKLIKALDGLRKPERVKCFVQACQADASGRAGFENRPYPQAEALLASLEAAKEISAKPLVEQGFKGQVLGEKLQEARIRAIGHLRQNSKSLTIN